MNYQEGFGVSCLSGKILHTDRRMDRQQLWDKKIFFSFERHLDIFLRVNIDFIESLQTLYNWRGKSLLNMQLPTHPLCRTAGLLTLQ